MEAVPTVESAADGAARNMGAAATVLIALTIAAIDDDAASRLATQPRGQQLDEQPLRRGLLVVIEAELFALHDQK